ncbi:hypothetical protein PL321_17690 [Caloramator sp. mosi_1]|uniref:hypothetical protein n=1 Tax=Caloramator sp. mosi_1 TaxID=3023090 RepID=UPI00235E2C89|nr:hypothetical protein [Caloramator sp. mosi_1]WDC84092.1 hypothetical protein PL321_17690 [Caloramator sp. mosi_1]
MQHKDIFNFNNPDFAQPISILEEEEFINYNYDELPLQRLPNELDRFASLGAIGIALNGLGKRVESEHILKRL